MLDGRRLQSADILLVVAVVADLGASFLAHELGSSMFAYRLLAWIPTLAFAALAVLVSHRWGFVLIGYESICILAHLSQFSLDRLGILGMCIVSALAATVWMVEEKSKHDARRAEINRKQ